MTSTTPRADLNAHAKEFVPSFSPPPAPRSPQPLTATLLSTTSTGVQLVAYYDDQGRYLYTGPYDPYVAGLAEYTAWDDRATPGGEGEAGTLTVDQAYVDAALAMLADAFPLYSTEQLFATFAEQGYDVVSTSDMLVSLENPTPSSRVKTTTTATTRSRTVRAKRAPNLNLSSESDFPSLAGGPGGTPHDFTTTTTATTTTALIKTSRASMSSSDSITPPSVSTPDGSVKDLQLDNHPCGTHGPVAVGIQCQADGTITLSLCVVTHDDAPPETPPRPSAWGRNSHTNSHTNGHTNSHTSSTPTTTATATTPRTGISFAEIARKAKDAAAAAQQPSTTPVSVQSSPVIMPAAPVIAPRTPTQAAPRVVTGSAVTKQYQEARGSARDLARLRNMCFMQATQAYLVGNKALAKELGARGRAYNEEMKAAHAAASANILRSRNANNPQGFIDLHGLHVKEALDVLDRELSNPHHKQHATATQICVGTGSHTKGARTPARLPAAVERYLNERRVAFSYVIPGLIELEPMH